MRRWLTLITAALATVALGAIAHAQDLPKERGGRGPRGMGQMGHGFGGREHGRLERALNLADKQKTAWEQLRKQHWESIKPLVDQERQIHGQIREQLEGGSPDAATIGKLMISAHEVGDQLRASHDELDAKFEQILDADQKAKFEALKQERAQHFRERRGGGPGFEMRTPEDHPEN